MFHLVRLSTSQSHTSIAALPNDLPNDINSRKLLIVLPEEPFGLLDLKKGYDAIQSVCCCFNIDINKDRFRIIKTKSTKKGIHIVEVSEASAGSDRQFLVRFYAFEIYDDNLFAPLKSNNLLSSVLTIYRKSCILCRQRDCFLCSSLGQRESLEEYKCDDCTFLNLLEEAQG